MRLLTSAERDLLTKDIFPLKCPPEKEEERRKCIEEGYGILAFIEACTVEDFPFLNDMVKMHFCSQFKLVVDELKWIFDRYYRKKCNIKEKYINSIII
jgi:hypothetical protein